MRAGLLRDLAKLVDDMRRRRQVGIAHPQIDDVASCGTGGGAHVIHFGDDIGRQTLHAVEFFGHHAFLQRRT